MSGKKKKAISRRDFFKMAGVGAGAAVTASVLKTNPVSAKTTSSGTYSDPAGRPKRPWWVKTVDQPTTEIDWPKVERYNERYIPELGKGTLRGGGFVGYLGEDEAARYSQMSTDLLQRGVEENIPGYTLRDQALSSANSIFRELSYMGPQRAKTPEEWGVPKWTGTPEEASRMVRSAMRHLGASQVAFLELDDNTRKLIYNIDPDGKEVVFADVDEPSEDETTRVFPLKAKWVIVYTVQMSEETLKRAPTVLGSQTTGFTYLRGRQIQNSTQEFLRGIGYLGLGEATTNALGISVAFAVLAGLGELSRLNRLVTPEFGPMVRVFKIFTDLPLAVDKPIDAGIMEFCKRCKKCAEACPSAALSFEDEPTWETRGPWNNPGHKAFFEDALKCRMGQREFTGTNCGICFAVCPYSKKDKAWVHEWVKAGSATAPFMVGFFRSMDDAFGYGAQKCNEDWWDLDLPEMGIDTTSIA
jgi:epoxyqueuosine reductase